MGVGGDDVPDSVIVPLIVFVPWGWVSACPVPGTGCTAALLWCIQRDNRFSSGAIGSAVRGVVSVDVPPPFSKF